MRLSREARVDTGGTHEVEGKGSLGGQAIPEVTGKRRVATSESRNEMILVGLDGPFGCVGAMNMGGGGELEGDAGYA